ncbi:MAG: hypothetical protein QW692_00660 [Nitrososphaerota archaeon]
MVECGGICALWPGSTSRAIYIDSGGRRYAYCKVCARSFPLETLTSYDSSGRLVCPCCKRVLRLIPRKPQSKRRMLMKFDRVQAMLYCAD